MKTRRLRKHIRRRSPELVDNYGWALFLLDTIYITEGHGMKILKEDKLTEIVIDLNKLKENRLDESWLSMFGYHVKNILNRMFGGSSIPVSVKGSPREVDAFAKAIGNEKRYIETAKAHGLEDPRTYKDKSKLKKATNAFERITGIKWPFK